ncbi:hypothetical protein SAMN05216325_11517 [Nitrosomonas marina]|uniref:Uncharacterized protein n=1 Tax=Nitrosomonas marina TaxID=917 RepID=A0A1H8FXU5_9PROT|nr:hypothetical protein SAMN05216325_11517 [Nitrosomonas marina]
MFSKITNLYWHIRYNRNSSIKRRYYRYVAAEKKRLLEAGVDPEELRLLCRALNQLFCSIFCDFPIAYNLYYVKLTVDVTIEGLRTKYKISFSILTADN